MDPINAFVRSARGHRIIIAVGIGVIALLIFHAGVVVGSHRHFGDEFGVGNKGSGFLYMRIPHGYIEDGHGAVGIVRSVSPTTFTITARDGSIQTIRISNATMVRGLPGTSTAPTLQNGAHVIVLGTKDQNGDLSADVIRIMPQKALPPTR